MEIIIYAIYTFLSAYTAGNMLTLQLQHYNLYPLVGKENFKEYIGPTTVQPSSPPYCPARSCCF